MSTALGLCTSGSAEKNAIDRSRPNSTHRSPAMNRVKKRPERLPKSDMLRDPTPMRVDFG